MMLAPPLLCFIRI